MYMKLHSRDRPDVRGNIITKEETNQKYKKENLEENKL